MEGRLLEYNSGTLCSLRKAAQAFCSKQCNGWPENPKRWCASSDWSRLEPGVGKNPVLEDMHFP